MRKMQKYSSAGTLKVSVNQRQRVNAHEHIYYIFDNGTFLHKLPWPISGTVDIIRQYEWYIQKVYGEVTIVFYVYLTPNTKDKNCKLR